LRNFPVYVKSVIAKMKYMNQAKYVQSVPTDCMRVLKNNFHSSQKIISTYNQTKSSNEFSRKGWALIPIFLKCDVNSSTNP